jgi:hypothetical protein
MLGVGKMPYETLVSRPPDLNRDRSLVNPIRRCKERNRNDPLFYWSIDDRKFTQCEVDRL